jgi:protein ImuB
MLWLALYLPQLPLESVTTGIDETIPRLLYQDHAGQPRVYRVNTVAARAGINPGMPLSAARALCQPLEAIARDERHEHAALNGLGLWALRFTSKVSLQPPQGLILEIGASLGLFQGLEKIHQQVLSELHNQGYSVSSGIAPVASAAWLLACHGNSSVVTEADSVETTLRPLPLSLLPIDVEARKALHRLGLQTIGDCLRLPRAGLSQRLGPPVVACLDRALGRAPDPREFIQPPDHFRAQILLPEPVSQVQPLLFVLQRLLRQLAGFLRLRDVGVQRMRLGLIPPSSATSPPIQWMPLTLLAPSRDPGQLFQLWQEKLQRQPLHQPVEGLELQARQMLPLQPLAEDIFGLRQTASSGFIHMLERLKNRLGEQSIRQPVCIADHRPERATRLLPFPAPTPLASSGLNVTRQSTDRPLWLLPRPRPLAQDDHGAPCLHGRLTLLEGPERIESGWWDNRDRRRDYYIAGNNLRQRLWIYHQPGESGTPATWFLHGFFS